MLCLCFDYLYAFDICNVLDKIRIELSDAFCADTMCRVLSELSFFNDYMAISYVDFSNANDSRSIAYCPDSSYFKSL